MNKNTDIRYLKSVGEKRAKALARLDIFTVGDLLTFYPRDYQDKSKIISIADAPFGENCCIKAIVDKKPNGKMIRKGMTIYKTNATDGESIISIVIFNNKYSAESLNADEEYLFFGRISGSLYAKQMINPSIIKAEGGERIYPVYHASESVTSNYLSKLITTALDYKIDYFIDPLPQKIKDSLCLMEKNKAIRQIHFPSSEDYLIEARRRLVFEELFIFQIGLMRLKLNKRSASKLKIKTDYSNEFFSLLAFEPTNAQRRAVMQSIHDMQSDYSMNRLLQGDVGSGKTAVAAALIYSAAENSMQSVLMAPTEILAIQHFNTLKSLFENTDIKIELLTGSSSAADKRRIKASLKDGSINLAVGTHALIQQDVEFFNLGLVITDEQHRFGVRQRNALVNKGENPHTLVMSATPIPRTLALIVYGDLDISVLDELPPGRQKIDTFCISSDKKARAFNYLKKHLDKGLQGYIVCPLIEDENGLGLASVSQEAEELEKNTFKNYSVGILHGKMKPKEKEKIMAEFISKKISLLISTTVIEVGVDVPNAVIMIIENAERFGLSQLHQLRGRIGRGKEKSTCILISDSKGENSKKRMEIMRSTGDGFKIADEDLKLRGPGDFFGQRQHGLPEMKIAMFTDYDVLNTANKFAKEVIKNDPNLLNDENKNLKSAITELFQHNKGLTN